MCLKILSMSLPKARHALTGVTALRLAAQHTAGESIAHAHRARRLLAQPAAYALAMKCVRARRQHRERIIVLKLDVADDAQCSLALQRVAVAEILSTGELLQ